MTITAKTDAAKPMVWRWPRHRTVCSSANHAGIAASAALGIRVSHKFTPHPRRRSKVSKGLRYRGLYVDPPNQAVALSIDGKTRVPGAGGDTEGPADEAWTTRHDDARLQTVWDRDPPTAMNTLDCKAIGRRARYPRDPGHLCRPQARDLRGRAGETAALDLPLRAERYESRSWRPARWLHACAEDFGSVPRQVSLVLLAQSSDLHRPIDSKCRSSISGKTIGDEHRSVFCDHDEAAVERRIKMRRKQQAIENVEALGVGVAIGPWLDVTRMQKFPYSEAGDRALTVPVIEQATTENLLADSLNHSAFSFRCPRHVCGFAVKLMKQ